MPKKILALCYILVFTFPISIINAQNVGIGTNTPKAALDVNSTTNGLLPPRMTFPQRNAIVNPEAGLIIYCTDCGLNGGELQYYNGASWFNINGNPASTNYVNLPSVTIGQKTWSTTNLNVATYRNGDPIPEVTDPTAWSNLTTGAYCWFNNDSITYAATYGRLYNLYAVNDPRGLAPKGWRVPTEADWNKLVKFIDAGADTTCQNCVQSTTAGGAMKSTSTQWFFPNTGANNSSGFNGLPGGYRNNVGSFFSNRTDGFWWSAPVTNADFSLGRNLNYNTASTSRNFYMGKVAFSVRVVRD